MDTQHQQRELRGDAERRTPLERPRDWRQSLDRLQKNPVVRRHVRAWLLGLIAFGPVR